MCWVCVFWVCGSCVCVRVSVSVLGLGDGFLICDSYGAIDVPVYPPFLQVRIVVLFQNFLIEASINLSCSYHVLMRRHSNAAQYKNTSLW